VYTRRVSKRKPDVYCRVTMYDNSVYNSDVKKRVGTRDRNSNFGETRITEFSGQMRSTIFVGSNPRACRRPAEFGIFPVTVISENLTEFRRFTIQVFYERTWYARISDVGKFFRHAFSTTRRLAYATFSGPAITLGIMRFASCIFCHCVAIYLIMFVVQRTTVSTISTCTGQETEPYEKD